MTPSPRVRVHEGGSIPSATVAWFAASDEAGAASLAAGVWCARMCYASPPMRRSFVVVAWIAIAASYGAHVRVFDFITDDGYISLRYAENLARHGALEYNVGERVEGYTNFLWTVALAGLLRLGAPLELAARALGPLLGFGVLVVTWLLARRRDSGLAALLAPALLAALPAHACWSSGGLETPMFTLLGLLGAALLIGDRPVAAGLAFAAAAMTRPEGALLVALAALADIKATRRLRWRLYLAFALPFGAFFAWRFAYYGAPFPNTFYVKTAGGAAFARGAAYLRLFAVENRLWALLPLAIFFRPRDRRLWLHAAFTVPVFLVYVAAVGGDFMALGRFVVPMAPYLALAAVEAVRTLRPAPRAWTAAATLLALAAYSAVGIDRATLALVGARDGVDGIGYLKLFVDDRLKVGRWMRQNLPKGTLVSVGGAGALPFASKLPILDAFGLNDTHIARSVAPSSDRPGHQKVAPLAYLLEREVDLVCFPPYAALERHGYRRVCYPVEVDPRTVPGGRYCCWSKRPEAGLHQPRRGVR